MSRPGPAPGKEGPADHAEQGARALEGLLPAAVRLLHEPALRAALEAGRSRGFFRPAEDEMLKGWFARFVTLRSELWRIVEELLDEVGGDLRRVEREEAWATFVVGYAAAAGIVRLDRALVEELASDPLVQRKLNEGAPEHRLPRKMFTRVYDSFTDPDQALLLLGAMRLGSRHRREVEAVLGEPAWKPLALLLAGIEDALDPSRRRYLKHLARYLRHAVKRRGASARQRGLFLLLEGSGRLLSQVGASPPRLVSEEVRSALLERLRPGDVVVTRREGAATNLVLPGYWPHAALYVGSFAESLRLGLRVDPERAERWSGEARFLEALADGVRLRTPGSTLAVDAVAILRPRLGSEAICRGLERALAHEGKLYNFDFDFFRSDRLVCTEVVYRAYDGLDGLRIPLAERAGRPTLSAEDLVALAVAGRGFDVVAAFRPPGREAALLLGSEAASALTAPG